MIQLRTDIWEDLTLLRKQGIRLISINLAFSILMLIAIQIQMYAFIYVCSFILFIMCAIATWSYIKWKDTSHSAKEKH